MSSVGTIIAGKYRLMRSLGAGGMGVVYKAENVAIGRTVALKILHGHLADDEVSLARFQREARTAASVAHRNLVEILDLGVEPSGAPYLVMEYVRGKSLAEALALEPRFEPRRAVRIAGQILAALAAVHHHGIIHRDLKPENILLTTRKGQADFVKVLDFGVAALSEDADRILRTKDLTPSGRVMGTPYYTSPEQIRGRAAPDARVDLWAVGVLLFQMLAGRRPFNASKLDDLCHEILSGAPPTFESLGVQLEPGLEAIVLRALEKDPARRYESATEMHHALEPFGAEPMVEEDPEPTDTFTFDLRALRERELAISSDPAKRESGRPSGAAAVSGAFTIAVRELARARVSPHIINQALGATKAEVHARFVGPMEPESWYSGAWFDFVERLDLRAGKGDRKLVAEAGREVVRRGDPIAFLAPTPAQAFARLPQIWTRLFSTGKPAVESSGRGHGRLRIDEQPDARLARSIAFVGVVEEVLRRSGAHRVDVRLAKSAVLGDPADRIEASWAES